MLKLSEIPAGAVMACEIFALFEHTGIYLGDATITELAGSGLVRAVSPRRFLDGRSGEDILVATDHQGNVLAEASAAKRASEQIYSYQPYDLLRNNCHRFTYHCVTGLPEIITSFYDLKVALLSYYHSKQLLPRQQNAVQWRVVDCER